MVKSQPPQIGGVQEQMSDFVLSHFNNRESFYCSLTIFGIQNIKNCAGKIEPWSRSEKCWKFFFYNFT
jgi:hypothetical protein